MAHGNTASKALLEIEKVVDESIKWMEEEKEPIPEPFGLKKFNSRRNSHTPAVHGGRFVAGFYFGRPWSNRRFATAGTIGAGAARRRQRARDRSGILLPGKHIRAKDTSG
jgi:hypothetical protein